MTPRYYYCKTVKIDGRQRLRPLPGQTDSTGAPIKDSYNIQADAATRAMYPLGTVFATSHLILQRHPTSPYYRADRIYPLDLPMGDYMQPYHIPSKDMTEAWHDFQSRPVKQAEEAGTLFAVEPAAFATSPTEPATGTLLEQLRGSSKLAVPTIKRDGYYIADKDWYLLVRNIRAKVNTLLIGASGSGKTELVMLACRKLGIKCHVYDMGSMHDPVSGLLGVHRLQQGGVSVFDYAQFTRDIQEPGVILLDELSRAPATTNNILFPCLDSRRMLPVEIAGGKDMRSIPVHPDCVFLATANVGVEYTGTMSMDRALTGRFFPLELAYLPAKEESEVLTRRCGIKAADAANIVAVAATVRNLYAKQEISCSISTRETLMAAQLVADGWTALEAMEYTFLPLFEGSRTDGERSIISKIFVTR